MKDEINMGEHYFSEKPVSRHNINTIKYNCKGVDFIFNTDSSVFSKSSVDKGTDILLNSIKNIHGNVLDMGCGYGVLGIVIKKLYPNARVVLNDINKRAVELANINAKLNNVSVKIYQGFGTENIPKVGFDFAVINPPIRAGKKIIYDLFTQIKYALNPNGTMYVVIRTKQGAKSAVEYIKDICFKVNTIEISSGYRVLECILGGNNE
ncbi:MAG: class I SAM-dependent methyltransferase [Christensenellaceae bacterium]|nr:class I SAM-dependent methyltransferase [Christensenellaceae bacterium]